jgi:hypothetical protein
VIVFDSNSQARLHNPMRTPLLPKVYSQATIKPLKMLGVNPPRKGP